MENPSQTTAISKDIFTEMVMQEAIKGVPVEAFKPPKVAKFAMVGGQLAALRDEFTTMEGRRVELAWAYAEYGDEVPDALAASTSGKVEIESIEDGMSEDDWQ